MSVGTMGVFTQGGRGSARVPQAEWDAICRGMETHFGAGDFGHGAVHGIGAVTQLVTRHFPPAPGDRNELPDAPLVL